MRWPCPTPREAPKSSCRAAKSKPAGALRPQSAPAALNAHHNRRQLISERFAGASEKLKDALHNAGELVVVAVAVVVAVVAVVVIAIVARIETGNSALFLLTAPLWAKKQCCGSPKSVLPPIARSSANRVRAAQ